MLRNFRRVRHHRRKFWQGRVAEVQQLEPRALLAGTVLVTFASNAVTITGDNKANGVIVDVTESGAVTITGLDGTKVRFGGEVFDAEEPVDLPVSTAALGITVNLKGGDDHLQINVLGALGTLAPKNLTVDTGDEDDRVEINILEGTTLNFSDIVSISTGEGSDLLELSIAGTVTIAKALTINSGADSDVVTINVDGALTAKAETSFFTGDDSDELLLAGDGLVTFDKTLKVDMGEDSDEFTVFLDQGILVKAAATITMADGDDSVGFSGSAAMLDFQKGLIVDLGTGNDRLAMGENSENLHSGGELKVLAGSGDDSVSIQAKLQLDGALTISTGDGEDEVRLYAGVILASPPDAPVANFIKGKVTIDTGDDQDVVEVTVLAGNSLTVNGAAAITTGRGDDGFSLSHFEGFSLSHFETVVAFTAGLTIDTGATAAASSGDDYVSLQGHSLIVTGALTINTGAGADNVFIAEALTVSGKLEIGTGSGNDAVTVFMRPPPVVAGAAGPANTIGSLTVNSGSGSDYVGVESTGEGTTRIGGAVSIITGAGLDEVEFIADADLTIVGALSFDTGSGDDHVLVQAGDGSIRVNGNETVILGDDDDCFIQATSVLLDEFRLEGSPELGFGSFEATLQVDGNVSVQGGAGDDFIGFAGTQVGKDRPTSAAALPASLTTFDLGAGDDVLGANEAIFRDLKILAGDGDDIIVARAFQIRGITNADLGAGDDQLVIDGSDDITTFNDNVTLNGGAGDDLFVIGGLVSLATGKKVATNGGTGTDTIANLSLIPDSAFNPVPVGIEDLDGDADQRIGIDSAFFEVFSNCLAGFETEDQPPS